MTCLNGYNDVTFNHLIKYTCESHSKQRGVALEPQNLTRKTARQEVNWILARLSTIWEEIWGGVRASINIHRLRPPPLKSLSLRGGSGPWPRRAISCHRALSGDKALDRGIQPAWEGRRLLGPGPMRWVSDLGMVVDGERTISPMRTTFSPRMRKRPWCRSAKRFWWYIRS